LAQSAKVDVETIEQPRMVTEADRKFILALVLIFAFVIMLLVPLARGDGILFTTVATAMSGLVGTIIGYFFGSEKLPSHLTNNYPVMLLG
jgi:hypothetical protein